MMYRHSRAVVGQTLRNSHLVKGRKILTQMRDSRDKQIVFHQVLHGTACFMVVMIQDPLKCLWIEGYASQTSPGWLLCGHIEVPVQHHNPPLSCPLHYYLIGSRPDTSLMKKLNRSGDQK